MPKAKRRSKRKPESKNHFQSVDNQTAGELVNSSNKRQKTGINHAMC